MRHLDRLLELVDNELKTVTDNGKFRTREEVDTVYKLIDIAKDINCIWAYEENSEDASYDAYDGGYSGARGRGRGANRYADGRYAPSSRSSYDDGGGTMRGRMARRGYSMNNQEYADKLREMADSAPDETSRQNILRMAQQMEG